MASADLLLHPVRLRIVKACMAYVAGLLADCDRYLAAGVPNPVRDGAAYRVAEMWLNEAEVADFVHDHQTFAQPRLANASGKGRRRPMLYSVLLPGPEGRATSDGPDSAPEGPTHERNESP